MSMKDFFDPAVQLYTAGLKPCTCNDLKLEGWRIRKLFRYDITDGHSAVYPLW